MGHAEPPNPRSPASKPSWHSGTESEDTVCHRECASAATALGRDIHPLTQCVINSLAAALELFVSSLQHCKLHRFRVQERKTETMQERREAGGCHNWARACKSEVTQRLLGLTATETTPVCTVTRLLDSFVGSRL